MLLIMLKILLSLGLLLLVFAPDATARRHDGSRDYVKRPRAANLSKIRPEQQNNTEVVAQVGGTASIKCYTHFIGDETVTWLKRDEDQLLTAGSVVYSAEKRYAVSHVRHQQLWELSVMDVRLTDAGTYECQMTTHPPTSLFFVLKVVEAKAVLQGAPEVHIQTGESLHLHCSVQHATSPPQFIFWYHNGSMINYAPNRLLEVMHHHYGSHLYIADVRWEDAGAYSCEPEKAHPANLTLHVVAGEKHAALHNGQGEGGETNNTSAQAGRPITTMLLASSCVLLLLITAYFDNICGGTSAEGGSGQEPAAGFHATRNVDDKPLMTVQKQHRNEEGKERGSDGKQERPAGHNSQQKKQEQQQQQQQEQEKEKQQKKQQNQHHEQQYEIVNYCGKRRIPNVRRDSMEGYYYKNTGEKQL